MIAAAADPSLVHSTYILPPDYGIMGETAEVFMKALLLGMAPEAEAANFADIEPVEILPYEEAVAYMRKKLPVDAQTYYALDDKMRYRAFTVSRLADGDAVQRVQTMIADAMENGTGMNTFLQMTEGELADAAGMGRGAGWYYETVYRTNTSTAYNVGRAINFEEVPPVALELIGIDDTRQTEICHSLTVPPFRRPYGDPVWETLWPPFHFNCRTTVRAIYDESEIDEAGGPGKFYSKGAPDFTPAEGFGKYPVDKTDSWWDLTDAMKERAGEYGLEAEFMEAREKLIGPENAPDNPAGSAAIKEAEVYARENLGIEYADYAGIDGRLANEWNANLERTLQEFPELKGRLNFTGSTEAQNKLMEPVLDAMRYDVVKKRFPGKPEAFLKQQAAALKILTDKEMNPENMIARFTLSADERLKRFLGIGINPKYGKSITALEELLAAEVKYGIRPPGAATIKAAYDHEVGHVLDGLLGLQQDKGMNLIYAEYSGNEAKITAGLSKYANKGLSDFIAEGWAEFCNNPVPRPLSDRIGRLILNRYALWKS